MALIAVPPDTDVTYVSPKKLVNPLNDNCFVTPALTIGNTSVFNGEAFTGN